MGDLFANSVGSIPTITKMWPRKHIFHKGSIVVFGLCKKLQNATKKRNGKKGIHRSKKPEHNVYFVMKSDQDICFRYPFGSFV